MAAAVIMATSCLDLAPKAQLSDDQVWSKASNFDLFANQFYGWTRDFQGSATVTYMNGYADGPHADTRSDLMCQTSVNQYSQGTNAILPTDVNYNTIYKRIYYTNLLLKRAENFEPKKDIAQYMGEAYFFRAYLHFELVQMYGDCILLTEPIDIDSQKLYGPRDNRLDVIRTCVEDLKTAAELLKEMPSETGELGAYAAWAMLSRVALYEASWQKYHNNNTTAADGLFNDAAEAAKKVMESKKYELFFSSELGGRDSYRYMFVLENVKCNPAGLTKKENKEYIFAKCHDEILKPIGTNITHGALNNAYIVTKKLADMYRCQNGLPITVTGNPQFKGYDTATSEFENRDNRMNGTLLKHGQKYWFNDCAHLRTDWTAEEAGEELNLRTGTGSGYANYKWATERPVKDALEGYDYPVIRYAEVLLNYAEAVYELNGAITDAQLNESLNLVRKRSNPTMTPLSNKLVNDHAGEMSMLQEIRDERTVELFFEGFRIDDLKRWKTAETEMPQNQLGVKYTGTWFGMNWTSNKRPIDNATGCILLYDGRKWERKHYLLPLPGDECQLNRQLGQNKDWE